MIFNTQWKFVAYQINAFYFLPSNLQSVKKMWCKNDFEVKLETWYLKINIEYPKSIRYSYFLNPFLTNFIIFFTFVTLPLYRRTLKYKNAKF